MRIQGIVPKHKWIDLKLSGMHLRLAKCRTPFHPGAVGHQPLTNSSSLAMSKLHLTATEFESWTYIWNHLERLSLLYTFKRNQCNSADTEMKKSHVDNLSWFFIKKRRRFGCLGIKHVQQLLFSRAKRHESFSLLGINHGCHGCHDSQSVPQLPGWSIAGHCGSMLNSRSQSSEGLRASLAGDSDGGTGSLRFAVWMVCHRCYAWLVLKLYLYSISLYWTCKAR